MHDCEGRHRAKEALQGCQEVRRKGGEGVKEI